ncbi:MAG: elongation factor P maturation arginine rhamnosyltransferase EarP [Zoogloeaceae bacterium]|jgi:uncharacterized repeat protein (TIGR03837 family)|nr:elongation factor P maturation arginine rhamnosyltransferase EarP [Zoogloeaceae bacterium]
MRWDIFCRVIDNFGDAGVCWRLARQLAAEHAIDVRLWLEDPAPLLQLAPDFAASPVQVRPWRSPLRFDAVADVVIEAFGCELPEEYLRAMARRAPSPCWLNLEYLSAEDWVEGCHGLASPHPRLPLVKHFFFPGFTKRTGGLLRESHLPTRPAVRRRRDALLAGNPDSLLVSLFCYETAPLAALFAAWEDAAEPLACLIFPGQPLAAARAALGATQNMQDPDGWRLGAAGQVRLIPVPFVAQDAYDELLAACDLNFVRGEDSFVRAQWAAQPFVWQPYPQEDDAHLHKLDAFLRRYAADLPEPAQTALAAFWRGWNGAHGAMEALAGLWPEFRRQIKPLARHGRSWRAGLLAQDDLASALVKFCATRV